MARDPEWAAGFAAAAAGAGSGQNTVPLLHRTERPGRMVLTGTETEHQVAATLADVLGAGFDAVLLKNYMPPGARACLLLCRRAALEEEQANG